MEKVLEKMAKQLNALDEASLMSLWEKYAKASKNFEPTQRWEESALIFCFIQAVHWKNMLFNHHWSTWTKLARENAPVTPVSEDPLLRRLEGPEAGQLEGAAAEDAAGDLKRCKVLRFRSPQDDDPV